MDSSSENKQQHTYIENAEIQEITHSKGAQDDSSSSDNLMNAEVRASAEKKLVRKLDMRLISTIILIYIMNYIDVRLVASPVLVFISNETPENSSDYSQVEGVGARSWVNWSILIAVKRLRETETILDLQYDTVVAILYVSYCPAQIPSNMVRGFFLS